MARQRFVKPEVFQHEALWRAQADCKLPLILSFIGLWCQCDCRGCFEWKPATLKLHILPFDDMDFGAVIDALESAGFVRSYVVGGRKFGIVQNFKRHQHIHPKEGRNKLIPSPPRKKTTDETRTELELDSNKTIASKPASNRYRSRNRASNTASNTAIPSEADTETESVGADGGLDAIAPTAETLVQAADLAIRARFNGSAEPLPLGTHATELAAKLQTAGISMRVAVASMHEQMLHYEDAKPPTTVRYFTKGILRTAKSLKPRDFSAADAPELMDTRARLDALLDG